LILQHILIAATAKTAVAARGLSNHTSKKLNQEVADEASHLLATIAVKPSMYKDLCNSTPDGHPLNPMRLII
jgi:hypothetical protein